jgi:hypothetical protein
VVVDLVLTVVRVAVLLRHLQLLLLLLLGVRVCYKCVRHPRHELALAHWLLLLLDPGRAGLCGWRLVRLAWLMGATGRKI